MILLYSVSKENIPVLRVSNDRPQYFLSADCYYQRAQKILISRITTIQTLLMETFID